MRTREMVVAGLFAALIAAGAFVSVPLRPVPFTFQVLFVLMAGLLVRPGPAAAAVLCYLLLGAAGLPVFSGGTGGPGVIVGPTGGYLAGFLAAAVAVSVVAGPASGRATAAWRLIACGVGIVLIYALGAAWLAVVTGVGLLEAIVVGVLPFLLLDAVKGFIAVAAAGALERVGVLEPAGR